MATISPEPPTSADALQEWVRRLAETDPARRPDALEGLPDPDDDPWTRVLHGLFPADGGPPASARSLLDALDQAGLDLPDARSLLGTLVGHPPVQSGWSDWETVSDRRELRERARVLAEAPFLLEDQADFLLFCLRSSDPAVYHPAAIAVGRHAASNPEVREALEAYAGDRGLDLEEPVHLEDVRSRRRVLLVQAGARTVSHAADDDGDAPRPPLPGDLPEDADDPLPEAPADAVALIRAVETLLEADDPDPALAQGAAALVDAVPTLDEATLSRWVVEAWADLLAAFDDPTPHEDAATALLTRLADVRSPSSGSLAAPLSDLLRLDAGLSLLPRLPEAVGDDILTSTREAADPSLRPVLLSRSVAWAARHPDPDPTWVDDAVDRLAHGAAPLPRAAATAALGDPDEVGIRLLEVLVDALSTGPSWSGRSPRSRATLALFALDAVRAGDPPPDRARSLLDDLGLLPPAATSSDPLLGLLLERLMEREPEGAAAVLDARLLHEADSPRLLMAVLGPDPQVPATALADALESRLRSLVHGDPSAEPAAALARTAVRRTSPAVYRALAEVAAGRTYRRPDGATFSLEAVARTLAQDAVPEDRPSEAWSTAPEETPPALGPARDRLRDRLAAIQEPAPPAEAVEAFLEAVGSGPPGTSPPADTVRGLLRATHPREGPLLAAGRPAWRTRTRVELEDALGDALRRVEERLEALHPRRLQALAAVADPAAAVADALADVRAAVLPHLPGPEATLLEAAISSLEDRLGRWSHGVDALLQAWDPEAGLAAGDALLEAVTDAWEPRDRGLILAVALRSLSDPEADAGAAPGEALDWALDRGRDPAWTADEDGVWDDWIRDLWVQAARRTMDGGPPDRVLDLLVDDRYAAARAGPEGRAVVDEARSWCFDRYRFFAAVRLNDDHGIVGTGWRFLAHFSPVWLALVVGAILMLDFGDAWREMAADGDVVGVGVTFLVGVVGAFAYTHADLRRRTPKAGPRAFASGVVRAGGFVTLCLVWVLAVTGALWALLSGTDQVVRGAGAPLHVAVWAGFALFVGIFFGRVAKET